MADTLLQELVNEPTKPIGSERRLALVRALRHLASSPHETALLSWAIHQGRIGLSQQERKIQIENLQNETALGLVSRVTMARRLNPGIDSDEEAITFLVDQQLQERRLAVALSLIIGEE